MGNAGNIVPEGTLPIQGGTDIFLMTAVVLVPGPPSRSVLLPNDLSFPMRIGARHLAGITPRGKVWGNSGVDIQGFAHFLFCASLTKRVDNLAPLRMRSKVLGRGSGREGVGILDGDGFARDNVEGGVGWVWVGEETILELRKK